jgi:hypothetical protein
MKLLEKYVLLKEKGRRRYDTLRDHKYSHRDTEAQVV